MDEEELEQPKKITIGNFFESIKSIDKVANRALKTSNSNLGVIQEQKSIIDNLSTLIEGMQSDIQEINNYIIVEKNEREDKLFEEQDKKQKEEMRERAEALKGEKGDQGDQGTQGTQGTQGEQGEGLSPSLGKGGGGLKTLLASVGILGATKLMGFLRNPLGLKKSLLPGGNNSAKDIEKRSKLIGEDRPRGLTGMFGGLADAFTGNKFDFDKRGGKKEDIKNDLKDEIKSEIKQELNLTSGRGESIEPEKKENKFNLFETINPFARISGMLGRKFGKKDEIKEVEGEKDQVKEGNFITNFFDKIRDFDGRPGSRKTKDKNKFYDKDGNYIGNNERKLEFQQKKDDLESKRDQLKMETTINPDGSITSEGSGTLLGGELYKPGEKMTIKQRTSIQARIMMSGEGSIDSQKLEDYKNSGGPLTREEYMKSENIEAGVFSPISDEDLKREQDLDKEGNIFSSIGGVADSLTGGVFDFDKRGDSKIQRVGKGFIDALSGNMLDLDKKGKMDLFGIRKRMENKKKKEAYQNNPHVQEFNEDKNELYDYKSKIPMNTTVNPDGSITSKGSGELLGDEPFTPGQPLTEKQKMVVKMGIDMGNTFSPEIMESYNMETIKPIIESNEKDLSSTIKPIIESNEKDLSSTIIQSVDANNQAIQVLNAQNQINNQINNPIPPNNNPSPLIQASPPQVADAEIKVTEAPIPFRKLLSSKKYLSITSNSKSGLPPEIASMIS